MLVALGSYDQVGQTSTVCRLGGIDKYSSRSSFEELFVINATAHVLLFQKVKYTNKDVAS